MGSQGEMYDFHKMEEKQKTVFLIDTILKEQYSIVYHYKEKSL